ncbi:MAG: helix-turn-helix domain-containing protein [Planctomycetaceae bacterium]|jgi:hypothetical protein|nr:helix-turn-helix domain-containing protein [Phycisphaerales bacterium]MCE2654322.1 helix-turn-helix domain-containing protein [Planctomycetaceae bacterium]
MNFDHRPFPPTSALSTVPPRVSAPSQPPAADRTLLVDRRKAARVLAVSPGTIDNLRLRGELPSIKIGSRRLYAIADLEQFIAARKEIAK